MPLTPATLTPVLVANLFSTGNIGPGVTQYATGVANGVCVHFTSNIKVTTVDAGSLGVGTGILPFLVAQPLLLTSLLSGFTMGGILGVMAPPLALGLANGLAVGLLSGFIKTNHPGIGTGAGIARLTGSTAVPAMINGFKAAGMKGSGPEKKARAIGLGLDLVTASFLMTIPIVGSASPAAGAGVGIGSIV
jgi:hypothetical protein